MLTMVSVRLMPWGIGRCAMMGSSFKAAAAVATQNAAHCVEGLRRKAVTSVVSRVVRISSLGVVDTREEFT